MYRNPWVIEEEMKTRLDEERRDVAMALQQGTAASSRGVWSRHVGEALIRAGQRLAGPEATGRHPRNVGAGC